MLGFLHKWRQSIRRKQVSLDEAKPIYEELVQATVQKISMSLLTPAVINTIPGCDNQNSGGPSTPVVSYQILHSFTVSLFEPGLEEQRDIFLKKISSDTMSVRHDSFTNLWIPLLQDLLFACEKLKISLSALTWQQLYQAVLRSFLLICVGKPPKPDFVQKCLSCPCGLCIELNQFLADPTQKVARLRMTPPERNHITMSFVIFGIDCTCTPEPQLRLDNVLITKNDRKDDAQRSVYEERKLEAATHLCAFDQQKLRTVLAGEYETIMSMSVLEPPESTASTSPLPPISANPAEEIARLEAEMERLVKSTPSSAPAPIMGNHTLYDPSRNWSSQSMSRGRAAIPPRKSTLPHTAASGASRVNLPATRPGTSALRAMTPSRISSTPISSTLQPFLAARAPGTAATTSKTVAPPRSLSRPLRPRPSTMIPHPVAGAKRKMVELVDLTLDDD